MTYVMVLLLVGVVLGLLAVASHPSPYFGALGLVIVGGLGCGVLSEHGGSFLSLILFLIYLGGMLVVFAYTAALAAEPYPETWGSEPVALSVLWYVFVVAVACIFFRGGWYEFCWATVGESGGVLMVQGDMSGVALMFSVGGGMLVISAWVLLLTLFVVLELTRGLSRGALRVV
uniref:NADH-ubiquinone oxidoreductase chain 6 n=1 Tax=Oxymonacanthus longirostris TaxID=303724 RepID=B7ZHP8_9TELE|nr:NADH dehydrogenase subunit 6 [Oxymonacanthus longirostris]BAH10419.1 NADH dehydrogenase subunit 6 [Oxymonacanthus longirostris]